MQNAPKKICLVGISLGFGGAERSMAMLSHMLAGKGYEVHLAILNDEVTYNYSGELLNLGIYKPKNDTLINRFWRLKQLRSYLMNHRIDCVIDHRPKNQYYRELFYNQFVYRSLKKIDVVHSSKQQVYFEASQTSLSKIFNRNVATVAVSKYIENAILKPAGIKNTTTIYNAFNAEWDQNTTHLPEPLSPRNYVLFYGRINDEVKDIRFLMRSFSKSKLWRQNIFLAILGEGNDAESLREYAMQQEAAAFILFFPYHENPFAFVKNAKFVTLTSHYEGFPMVLVEALSLGTPVVTLDIVSGPSEIVKHRTNGLLVKNRNETEFAQAMTEMFQNDQLYHNCKENSRNTVVNFNMENIAQQWDDLLKSIT